MNAGSGFGGSSSFFVYGGLPGVNTTLNKIEEIRNAYKTIAVDPFENNLVIIKIENPNKRINQKKLEIFMEYFERNKRSTAFIRKTRGGYEIYLLMRTDQNQEDKQKAIEIAIEGIDFPSFRKKKEAKTIDTPWCIRIIKLPCILTIEEGLRIANFFTNEATTVAFLP